MTQYHFSNTLSTLAVPNLSFHSLVFPSPFQDTHQLSLTPPYPHQAFISIRSILRLQKFVFPSSAPTSGWKTYNSSSLTIATTAPMTSSLDETSSKNSVSSSTSRKTKLRVSTSPYLFFNATRSHPRNRPYYRILLMICQPKLQPISNS